MRRFWFVLVVLWALIAFVDFGDGHIVTGWVDTAFAVGYAAMWKYQVRP